MDFKVISVDEDTGKITFGFGIGTSQKVTGFNKLIQMIVVKLLKTPGRDIASPESGGGLLGTISGNINAEDTSETVAEISPRVKKVEEEILDEQSDTDLPSEERLSKLNVINVSIDPDNITSYNLTIEVINEKEETARAVIDVSLLNRR